MVDNMIIDGLEVEDSEVQNEVRKMLDKHLIANINGVVAYFEDENRSSVFSEPDYDDVLEDYLESSEDYELKSDANALIEEYNNLGYTEEYLGYNKESFSNDIRTFIRTFSEKVGKECLFDALNLADTEFAERNKREPLNFYIVSDWLEGRLNDNKALTESNFLGLTIWGREASGQGIYMDELIKKIWADNIFPDSELKKELENNIDIGL